MKIIENKNISWEEFILELARISQGGKLDCVLIRNNHIYDIPNTFTIYNRFKYKGRYIELFFGFFATRVIFTLNNFSMRKK